MKKANAQKINGVTFVNLCPHDITLMDGNIKIVFKRSGTVARINGTVSRTSINVEIAEGLEITAPVRESNDHGVYGIPEPEEGVIYITSYLVAQFVARHDVIAPLTDETAIRDENEKVMGVRGFQRFLKES